MYKSLNIENSREDAKSGSSSKTSSACNHQGLWIIGIFVVGFICVVAVGLWRAEMTTTGGLKNALVTTRVAPDSSTQCDSAAVARFEVLMLEFYQNTNKFVDKFDTTSGPLTATVNELVSFPVTLARSRMDNEPPNDKFMYPRQITAYSPSHLIHLLTTAKSGKRMTASFGQATQSASTKCELNGRQITWKGTAIMYSEDGTNTFRYGEFLTATAYRTRPGAPYKLHNLKMEMVDFKSGQASR